MKRSVIIEGTGQELAISKGAAISLPRNFIHFDEAKGSNTWALVYSKALLPSLLNWAGMTMMRED
jgi:hypothetical protein